MRLGILKEPEGENRVAIVPNSVKKLTKNGFKVYVESGSGILSNYSDELYSNQGAIVSKREDVLSCELLITIRILEKIELRKGMMLACVADPFRQPEMIQMCMDMD
ncbi:MAG: hypothetical protein ACKVHF_06045, partial [Candidatus Poseidoniales archaeon]